MNLTRFLLKKKKNSISPYAQSINIVVALLVLCYDFNLIFFSSFYEIGCVKTQ